MRQKFILTLQDAERMSAACLAEARTRQWNVSVAIVDEAGYMLHLARLDGAPLPSAGIAEGKAKSAALARVSTKMLEDGVKERPGLLTFPGRVPVQGGVPLMHEGQCVGGIGVSGVKSNEDEQVALVGAALLIATAL